MSHYREAIEVAPFPWLPLLILLIGGFIVALIARWGFQYAYYLLTHLPVRKKHKKHKKHRKQKYSDSESDSSE